MTADHPDYTGFYTISKEYNGSPNGPHYVIRQYGKHYVGWELTRDAALARIETMNGRYVP